MNPGIEILIMLAFAASISTWVMTLINHVRMKKLLDHLKVTDYPLK